MENSMTGGEGQNVEGIASPPIQQMAPVAPATPPAPPAMESGGDVFENMSQKKPMDMKSILLFGLLIAMSVYGIYYYKKGIEQLKNDPNQDEYDRLSDDIEELKYNVKKALGVKYKATT